MSSEQDPWNPWVALISPPGTCFWIRLSSCWTPSPCARWALAGQKGHLELGNCREVDKGSWKRAVSPGWTQGACPPQPRRGEEMERGPWRGAGSGRRSLWEGVQPPACHPPLLSLAKLSWKPQAHIVPWLLQRARGKVPGKGDELSRKRTTDPSSRWPAAGALPGAPSAARAPPLPLLPAQHSQLPLLCRSTLGPVGAPLTRELQAHLARKTWTNH